MDSVLLPQTLSSTYSYQARRCQKTDPNTETNNTLEIFGNGLENFVAIKHKGRQDYYLNAAQSLICHVLMGT